MRRLDLSGSTIRFTRHQEEAECFWRPHTIPAGEYCLSIRPATQDTAYDVQTSTDATAASFFSSARRNLRINKGMFEEFACCLRCVQDMLTTIHSFNANQKDQRYADKEPDYELCPTNGVCCSDPWCSCNNRTVPEYNSIVRDSTKWCVRLVTDYTLSEREDGFTYATFARKESPDMGAQTGFESIDVGCCLGCGDVVTGDENFFLLFARVPCHADCWPHQSLSELWQQVTEEDADTLLPDAL